MEEQHKNMGMSDILHTDLRLLLDAPLREHATMAVGTMKATLLHTPDREALQDALDENTTAVAEAIEAGYPGTHDDFLELWRGYVGYYKAYAQAVMENDEPSKEDAKDKLDAFAGTISNLLADASPHLDPDDLEDAFSAHADHITTIIEDLAAEEYDDAYACLHDAYEHMGMLAELLARHASARQIDTVHL